MRPWLTLDPEKMPRRITFCRGLKLYNDRPRPQSLGVRCGSRYSAVIDRRRFADARVRVRYTSWRRFGRRRRRGDVVVAADFNRQGSGSPVRAICSDTGSYCPCANFKRIKFRRRKQELLGQFPIKEYWIASLWVR